MATPAAARILTLNGGSSSLKFALFEAGTLRPVMRGKFSGIGLPHGEFSVEGGPADASSRSVAIPDQASAIALLLEWLHARGDPATLLGAGHRVVHGGPAYSAPVSITPEVLRTLREFIPFDPEHLPEEIRLIEALQGEFPRLPQIACFDTAFHHSLPRVARLLPLPRRYDDRGVRRYGFHGLSYAYLLQRLAELAGLEAAHGRLVLAHLGSGASMAAVRDGQCIDTSMAFTPAAGLVMGTRSGDLDPGLMTYLSRSDGLSVAQIDHLLNHESGLLGVSETSPAMQSLLERETSDLRAAEAVELFCYQARKWIGAYSAVLGGLDTLVFSGGIGESCAPVRARICSSLSFLGIEIDESRNTTRQDVISADSSRVTVRVIPANEELMIAQAVEGLLIRRTPTSEE